MSERTKATILCVAAEQLTLAVRGLVLQSEGYEVVPASTIEDALCLAVTRQPSLIICERTLGRESGLALAGGLKQLQPNTPILMITGVMEAFPQTLSVDAVMTKIDGPDAFLQNVAALLERPEGSTQAA
jgi:DNA-binding response OmpR family regulator